MLQRQTRGTPAGAHLDNRDITAVRIHQVTWSIHNISSKKRSKSQGYDTSRVATFKKVHYYGSYDESEGALKN